MISVELRGALKLRDQLKLVAISPAQRRSVLLKVAREVAKRLKLAIRKTVQASQIPLIYPDRAARSAGARRFSRLVAYRAGSDQAVVFDKGLERQRTLAEGATEEQARKLRKLGFKLSVGYIQRHFSQGLAGLLIREMETESRKDRAARGLSPRKAPRDKRRGSLVMLVWRKHGAAILKGVNVPELIRLELATR